MNLDKVDKDDFVRFIKSIEMEGSYIPGKIKYYPKHWDHIEERVRTWFLSMKKAEKWSKHMENIIKQIDVKNIY